MTHHQHLNEERISGGACALGINTYYEQEEPLFQISRVGVRCLRKGREGAQSRAREGCVSQLEQGSFIVGI